MLTPAELGVAPGSSALSHLWTIQGAKDKADTEEPATSQAMLSIGAGLPPIPGKLVKRIQAGEFIDMSELLPEHLGTHSGPPLYGEKEDRSAQKRKHRHVTHILEWLQCYSTYMAALTAKHPERIQDLLGYQALILEARMEYDGDGWLGYDRRFRQRAAANPDTTWARIDPTLWNIAFAGQARATRCRYCFSLTHQAEECEWAPPASKAGQTPAAPSSKPPNERRIQICYEWNHNPDPICPYPACKYLHICLYCGRDRIPESQKDHKAMYCPRRRRPNPTMPQQGRPAAAAWQTQPQFVGATPRRYRPY